jgi:acyl carrier protein
MKVVREDIVAVVRDANVVSDPDKLRDDITLADQGVDSLEIFNLILLLQEKYGIEIPDDDIDPLVSVPAIVNYLNQRLE